MNGKHRIGIALLLAAAAAASTVGIARSVTGDHTPPTAVSTTDKAIVERQAALDAAERDIARSLAQKPPKLPPISSPPAAAPSVIVVRRPATSVTPAGSAHDVEGYEDSDEHAGDHEDDD